MKRVYIKEQVCMGCHLCEVYCLQKHARSKDLVKAYKKEFPRALSRLRVDESGIVSLSIRCQHCVDAPCIRACLTGALSRDPSNSLVSVDEDRCIGCARCVKGCTQFGNGSLYLQIRHDLCVGCNECAIAAACPAEAIRRVPADQPYIPRLGDET